MRGIRYWSDGRDTLYVLCGGSGLWRMRKLACFDVVPHKAVYNPYCPRHHLCGGLGQRFPDHLLGLGFECCDVQLLLCCKWWDLRQLTGRHGGLGCALIAWHRDGPHCGSVLVLRRIGELLRHHVLDRIQWCDMQHFGAVESPGDWRDRRPAGPDLGRGYWRVNLRRLLRLEGRCRCWNPNVRDT